MITSKQKSLAKYLLFLCVITISACYENVEGCLDISALNYNAAADVDCDECCSYPEIQLSITTQVDTLSFSRDTKYTVNEIDTIILHDIYIIFSDFILQGLNQEYEVTDMYAFVGNSASKDDLVFEDFTNTISSIGTIIINDSITTLSLQVGLPAEIDDKDNNFEQHPDIETIIDSMYYDSDEMLNFFRLEFSHIKDQDTIQYTINLSSQEHVFSETFPFETNINYGENIVIALEIDLLDLFEEIDFETQNLELIEEAILNNLRNNLFN